MSFELGLTSLLIEHATRGARSEVIDALPILAFTLREMYDLATRGGRDILTMRDYQEAGQIEGAIRKRTELAESLISDDSRPLLDRLLLRFVTMSEDRRPAGRPASRDQLPAAEQAIVEKLEDQRLLTGDGTTVRLAHEQLISSWPRLKRAVDDRHEDLLLETRLERQAADWKRGNGGLLGRDAAAAAAAWLARENENGTQHASSASTSAPPSARCAVGGCSSARSRPPWSC